MVTSKYVVLRFVVKEITCKREKNLEMLQNKLGENGKLSLELGNSVMEIGANSFSINKEGERGDRFT